MDRRASPSPRRAPSACPPVAHALRAPPRSAASRSRESLGAFLRRPVVPQKRPPKYCPTLSREVSGCEPFSAADACAFAAVGAGGAGAQVCGRRWAVFERPSRLSRCIHPPVPASPAPRPEYPRATPPRGACAVCARRLGALISVLGVRSEREFAGEVGGDSRRDRSYELETPAHARPYRPVARIRTLHPRRATRAEVQECIDLI